MPTSYEIYQTYLRGPAAVIRLFEQALGTQAIYGPPDPDTQQRAIEGLSEDIGGLKHQIARLQEELRETRSDNHRLRRRNAELEAVITKDSHNSSRPPSSDPPWAKRTEDPTPAVGQTTRRPSRALWGDAAALRSPRPHSRAPPARVPKLPRVVSRGARRRPPPPAGLGGRAGEVEGHGASARGASMPGVRADDAGGVREGSPFGRAVRAGGQGQSTLPPAVPVLPYQRTSEAMRDLFGCRLSAGTVANIVRECADELVETELKIKQKLRRSAVIHSDETGCAPKSGSLTSTSQARPR